MIKFIRDLVEGAKTIKKFCIVKSLNSSLIVLAVKTIEVMDHFLSQ